MAAVIVFSMFCAASIVFLVSFFVALWNDRKHSRYVLKVHRIAHLDVAPPVIDETEAVTSRSKVVCSRFIELPNRGIGNLYVDSGSTH